MHPYRRSPCSEAAEAAWHPRALFCLNSLLPGSSRVDLGAVGSGRFELGLAVKRRRGGGKSGAAAAETSGEWVYLLRY
ncbi:hypothetical protein E2562_002032 [Oryza meyeriana var. granulata]|uniref:Uncharacterized protein n=1 Tax=Oryza meyeriana var. granulata TaxID=110450 RepID=A0A6G1C3M1_9ORYZ|nr:hypothetical protein E2562_002032 [Oryza meyeriana var. granulata]